MNDLDAVANLNLLFWLLPAGLAIGLTLSSVYRAFAARAEARVYAVAAAVLLGALTLSVAFFPLGYVPMTILAILGLGTWAASVIVARGWILWAEAVILPVTLIVLWLFL